MSALTTKDGTIVINLKNVISFQRVDCMVYAHTIDGRSILVGSYPDEEQADSALEMIKWLM